MARTSREAGKSALVLVVPLGSFEQHGPHLPLDTDTRIAVSLADAAVDRLGGEGFLVAPPVAYSASDEHSSFPGTLSAGTEATIALLEALRRSSWWAAGTVVVNGHGGNADALSRIAPDPRWRAWSPSLPPGGDLHAGRTETSLALHLFPDLVRTGLVEKGAVIDDARAAWDAMREGGVAAVSANGVLGDPTGASAAEGADIHDAMVADLSRFLDAARREWTDAAR